MHVEAALPTLSDAGLHRRRHTMAAHERRVFTSGFFGKFDALRQNCLI